MLKAAVATVAGLGVLLGVGAAVAYAQTPPKPSGPAPLPTGGAIDILLQTNTPTYDVSTLLQEQVTVRLPQGCTWDSSQPGGAIQGIANFANTTTGGTPGFGFTYVTPLVLTVYWLAPCCGPQKTVLTFTTAK